MFIRQITSTTAIGLLLFVTFAIFLIPLPPVTAIDDKPVATETHMVPVAIHMTEGYELSPEPASPDDMEQSAACPNGYVGEGLLGFGYLKRFGHVYPRYIGTWATKELKDSLVVDGTIGFEVYYYKKSDSSGTPHGTITLQLMKNEDPWIPAQKTGNLEFKETVQKAKVEYTAEGNITPLQKGDVLQLKVTCEMNGNGAYIYFGSQAYSSGFMMSCNALNIVDLVQSDRGGRFQVEYIDSFGISPARVGATLKIDGVALTAKPSYGMNPNTYNRLFIWDNREIDITPKDQHDAEAFICYNPDLLGTDSNESVSFSIIFVIPNIPFDVKGFAFSILSIAAPILFLVVVLVIILVAAIKLRRRFKGKFRFKGKGRSTGKGSRTRRSKRKWRFGKKAKRSRS